MATASNPPAGRITPADLGLWQDAHIAEFKRNADFIHAQGAAVGVQLAHAGRKASCDAPWRGGKALSAEQGGWQTVAPSAIAFSDNSSTPHALTHAEIVELVDAFAAAAERALAADMDMIELHCAHGYLMHEFLSPLSNTRDDDYGGSLANRARFPLEVVRAVRAVWPKNRPLFVRISCTDWADGGWDIDADNDNILDDLVAILAIVAVCLIAGGSLFAMSSFSSSNEDANATSIDAAQEQRHATDRKLFDGHETLDHRRPLAPRERDRPDQERNADGEP